MHLAVEANPEHVIINDETAIVRHSRRPAWGLALMLWEREGKRGYTFEDGAERTFKLEYCGLFARSAAPADVAAKLRLAVESAVQKTATLTGVAPKKRVDVPTLGEQVAVFHHQFADGMAGAAWQKSHRGAAGGRRLKRHRNAAVTEAQTLMARAELDELLAAGRYEVVLDRAHSVLTKSDLVTKSQLRPLDSARRSAALAIALRNYLYEADADGAHFDEFLRLLGRSSEGRISWPLMTALRALVNPDTDVCVKPSVFMAQARLVSPSLSNKSRPTGTMYNRWVAMAQDLRAQLAGSGVECADLLDVYDFVWLTLRPAARVLLLEVRDAAALDAPVVEAPTEADSEVPSNVTAMAADKTTPTPDEVEAA